MQIITSTAKANPGMSASNEVYKTMLDTFRQVSSTEGTRRLWKGVGSVIMGAGPAHAVYFGTYEIIKESLGGNQQGQQILATGIAGSMATIASDALMNPFDGQSVKVLIPLYRTCLLVKCLLIYLLFLLPTAFPVFFCLYRACQFSRRARLHSQSSSSECKYAVPNSKQFLRRLELFSRQKDCGHFTCELQSCRYYQHDKDAHQWRCLQYCLDEHRKCSS